MSGARIHLTATRAQALVAVTAPDHTVAVRQLGGEDPRPADLYVTFTGSIEALRVAAYGATRRIDDTRWAERRPRGRGTLWHQLWPGALPSPGQSAAGGETTHLYPMAPGAKPDPTAVMFGQCGVYRVNCVPTA
jgi:hypothetical protein